MLLTIIIAAAIAIVGVMAIITAAQQQAEYNAAHGSEYDDIIEYDTIIITNACDIQDGVTPRTMRARVVRASHWLGYKPAVQEVCDRIGWDFWEAHTLDGAYYSGSEE